MRIHNDNAFILRVLGLTSYASGDMPESLMYRTDGEYAPITFFINCSDEFFWGGADCEELTPENIHILEEALEDCRRVNRVLASCYAASLFCCRVRKMRPQGCCYPSEREFWPLFDACGPEREVGLGNPYPLGEGQ